MNGARDERVAESARGQASRVEAGRGGRLKRWRIASSFLVLLKGFAKKSPSRRLGRNGLSITRRNDTLLPGSPLFRVVLADGVEGGCLSQGDHWIHDIAARFACCLLQVRVDAGSRLHLVVPDPVRLWLFPDCSTLWAVVLVNTDACRLVRIVGEDGKDLLGKCDYVRA